jgi:hypothetical protein
MIKLIFLAEEKSSNLAFISSKILSLEASLLIILSLTLKGSCLKLEEL